MKTLKFESLHNHSTASDGVLTRLELLAEAEKLGIGVMAITDHDTVPDEAELRRLRQYDGPVKWLVGVELSSWVPRAVGGSDRGALHVLGLFVDPTHRPLVEFCAQAEDSRRQRMRVYVAHLQSLGFAITEAEVEAAATSRNIGKPHMVKAVMANSENRRVAEALRERMRQAAEHDLRVKVVYDRMMVEGPGQYPYQLFMGSEAYFPAPQSDFGSLLPLEDTVKLIRGAGGLAVLAHWYVDQAKLPAAALEALVAGGGLDGLETEVVNVISDHSGYARDITYLRELSQRYDLFVELGADGHTPADFAAFVRDPVAERSVGQTARIIERARPDLRWSNLGR